MSERSNIDEIQNKLIIFALTVIIIIFLITGGIMYRGGTNQPSPDPPRLSKILIIGTQSGPADLDPVDAWDSASNDVIRQVSESLFFYDYRDPFLPRVNWLAESYSWPTPTTLEINIRTGIKFHDGMFMDAAACAWNFDRLMWLMNHTGEMPAELTRAKIHSLYEFPDGSPVMTGTNVVDGDTFQILLSAPYTQLLAAMAYVSCNILSPVSTPAERFLDKSDPNDLLVGTGPYVYEYYTADTEVRFTKDEDYWGTPTGDVFPQFDVLVFDVIDDPSTRNYALLAGDIDYISNPIMNLFDNFKESQHTTFHEYEQPSLPVFFLGFNHNYMNVTWRKAISYAFNYTYIIYDYWQSQMMRAYSFVSPSFGLYFDPNIVEIAPYCNYTIARQVIIDDLGPVNSIVAGLPNGLDPKADSAAWDSVTLETFNYTYNINSQFDVDLYQLLRDWLGKIGINLEDGTSEWYNWLYPQIYIPDGYDHDHLRIFRRSWSSDYLDPMNFIQPLISNASLWNQGQINDPWAETMITLYNTDVSIDEFEKIEIINNISKYLQELYSFIWIYHSKVFTVHKSDLYNVPYNAFENFWALPIKRNATWVPGQWYNTL